MDHRPDPRTDTFTRLRPRLHGIAYRMLGTAAEAEDVVQDAWLRWHGTDAASLDSAEAWLVTVTTRLAIDRLRAAKAQRAHYPGFWLPEPQMEDGPDRLLETAHEVSVAFLAVLERLAPEARAAFLLREVFDMDYGDLARTLGKTEAATRQIVHRAKAQVRDARPRFAVPDDQHHRLLQGFADASHRGDLAQLQALLADDAVLLSDGGGKVPSFGQPLVGAERIARLFYAGHRRHGDGIVLRVARLNGAWGLLRFIDGALESAQAHESDGHRIVRIHVQRNPDKLARLAAALR